MSKVEEKMEACEIANKILEIVKEAGYMVPGPEYLSFNADKIGDDVVIPKFQIVKKPVNIGTTIQPGSHRAVNTTYYDHFADVCPADGTMDVYGLKEFEEMKQIASKISGLCGRLIFPKLRKEEPTTFSYDERIISML